MKLIQTTGIVLVTLVFAGSVEAVKINPDGWEVPRVNGGKCGKERKEDIIDTIPGDETFFTVCQAGDGKFYNILKAIDNKGNKRVYGYYVDTDGKLPMEFTLGDVIGNGIFTHKYSVDESWPTPVYLLEQKQVSQ